MKEILIGMFVFFALFFFPLILVAIDDISNPFDYAKLTDVEYKAVVVDEEENSGKIIVTERLTFDIHAVSKENLFYELWRALPENKIDGLTVDYKVNSAKQILDDGSEIVYKESSKLYWDDNDYINPAYGPHKWYHSEGPYSEALRRYECLMLYPDAVYRDKLTFEIEYVMNNASFRYGDCSELYLCMYSEETIKDLNSFKGEILIPNNDMPAEGNYYAHTYGTNKGDFSFYESKNINPGYYTFYFDLDKDDLKFNYNNQYIEFALVSFGADKHIFTDYAPVNTYYDDAVLQELKDEHIEYEEMIQEYEESKRTIFSVCLILSFGILVLTHKFPEKIRKKYQFFEPSMQSIYCRDIPSDLDPCFASTLAFCRHTKPNKYHLNKDGFSSILLSLVRKGYIELQKIDNLKDWKFKNVKIVVKHGKNKYASARAIEEEANRVGLSTNTYELEKLTRTEELYFNLISKYSYGVEISMKKLQQKIAANYASTEAFINNINNAVESIGVKNNYFQKFDYENPKKEFYKYAKPLLITGIISLSINLFTYFFHTGLAYGSYFILGFTAIICSIYLKQAGKKYILLTQFGEDEYLKWYGLYKFLDSETLMNERTLIELPLWEKYLVYATAFGISEKVIKALNIRCPDVQNSSMLRNPYYRTRNFYHTGRSFRTSATHAYKTSRHISTYGGYNGSYGGSRFGNGFGSGYGGGGRGGGGGGGGH